MLTGSAEFDLYPALNWTVGVIHIYKIKTNDQPFHDGLKIITKLAFFFTHLNHYKDIYFYIYFVIYIYFFFQILNKSLNITLIKDESIQQDCCIESYGIHYYSIKQIKNNIRNSTMTVHICVTSQNLTSPVYVFTNNCCSTRWHQLSIENLLSHLTLLSF